LAEEVKSASRSVPLSILWSFFSNALVAFIVLVTFLFAIPDIDATLDPTINPSGSIFLYVFQQASYRGSIPLTTVVLLVLLGSSIDCAASTSRQFFAFARDGGFPFQAWLSKVCHIAIAFSYQEISKTYVSWFLGSQRDRSWECSNSYLHHFRPFVPYQSWLRRRI
jgi:amino acid transporter